MFSIHDITRWTATIAILFLATPLWAETADTVDKPGVNFAASGEAGAGYLAQLVIGLMIVVIGILALAWFLRRLNLVNAGAGGALRVLGGVSVGQRERIVLLQVGEKQMLVGVAPGSVRMLHELDEPLELGGRSAPTAGESGFAQQLAAVLAGKGKGGAS